MHFNESVRISDGVRLNHPNIRRQRILKRLSRCLFVMDLPVDLFGCSIFNKMALWLLSCHHSEFRSETRRLTESNYETSAE
jgi:hypothetical protein